MRKKISENIFHKVKIKRVFGLMTSSSSAHFKILDRLEKRFINIS